MSVSSVSISNMFSNDSLISKMEDPNVKWGDLLTDEVKSVPSVSLPFVSKKKAIQKHYPVLVRLQPSKTLGIQWNLRKLADWRVSHSNPLDWKPYETAIACEMIQALQHSGWNVAAPAHPSFICSISRDEQAEWMYEEPDCPTMICLNDIKLFFPVIWHKLDTTSTNCKMYSLEMYNDKIHRMAMLRGVNPDLLTNHLSRLLTKTLQQSPAWSVVQSTMVGEHSRLIL